MLWYYRLGYRSFLYLKKLFPSLFTKSLNVFQCEIYQLSKHVHKSYPIQPYKSFHPFSMIHSDVWGQSKIKNITRTRWFVYFVDDHIRISWIFLMKDKLEVSQIFKKIYNMIQTQFHAKIQALKTDNARDYFNSILREFLSREGIVHQSFWIETPQQNGIAERKNRYLLEVVKPLRSPPMSHRMFREKLYLLQPTSSIECLLVS